MKKILAALVVLSPLFANAAYYQSNPQYNQSNPQYSNFPQQSSSRPYYYTQESPSSSSQQYYSQQPSQNQYNPNANPNDAYSKTNYSNPSNAYSNSTINYAGSEDKQADKYPQDRAASAADNDLNRRIRERISDGWFWNSYKTIILDTRNGVVTVAGVVEDPEDPNKIIIEIRKIEGVRAVNNALTVKDQARTQDRR